jgi:hypothetical protein
MISIWTLFKKKNVILYIIIELCYSYENFTEQYSNTEQNNIPRDFIKSHLFWK